MNYKKIVQLVILNSLFSSACSKNNFTSGNQIPTGEVVEQTSKVEEKTMEEPKAYLLWKELLLEEKDNLALTELLAQSVYGESRDYVQKNRPTLSLDEVGILVDKIKCESEKKKRDYLFYATSFKNDDSILKKSLFNQIEEKGAFFSVEKQYMLIAVSRVKDDLIKNILSSYDQRIDENSKKMAVFILKDINDNRTDLKLKLEQSAQENKTDLKDLIKISLRELKAAETLFKSLDTKLDEQIIASVLEIVSSKMYKILREEKNFQEILKTYKLEGDISLEAKEAVALIAGLENYQREMRKDWADLGEGLKGIYNDSSDLLNKTKSYDFKDDEKVIQTFLYNSFLGNKNEKSEVDNLDILNKQISLNRNFANTIDKVGKLNDNFNVILESTEKMAKILNVDLPTDLKKAIVISKKTGVIFKTLHFAIDALKSGGILGALNALSSGPMMSLMGLNTDTDVQFKGEVLSRLGLIDQKLDQVMNLQLKTIKIQVETMSMLKNMAVMIDAYHWQEMDLLSDIKSLQLMNLEMEKIEHNTKLRSCERLFSYQLNAKKELSPYKFLPFEDVKMFDVDIQVIKNNMNNFENVYKMISSTESNGWDACLMGLNEAFGSLQLAENPIRSIYGSNENENFFKFNKIQYAPLVNLLNSAKRKSVFLHLPVTQFSSLEQKYDFMRDTQGQVSEHILGEHISSHLLARYTMELLAFYPFVNFDKEVWKDGLERVLREAIDRSKSQERSRDYYLLKNNLTLIQSAIAQEALLSGELIFDELLKRGEEAFRNNVNLGDGLPYAVATNRILVMNLLRYFLIGQDPMGKKGVFLKQYRQAYESRDLTGLAPFFSNAVIAQNLSLDSHRHIVLKLIVDKKEMTYLLPTPEELEEGRILYSENMYRLHELERRVIDALIKVSPTNYSIPEKDAIGRMLINF